jgi:hypothetical protein
MKKVVAGLLAGAVLAGGGSLALAGNRGADSAQVGREYRLCLATQELQKNLAYVAREAHVIGMYQIYRIRGCAAYIGH